MASQHDRASSLETPDLSRPSPSRRLRTSEPLFRSWQNQLSPHHSELLPPMGVCDSSHVNAELTPSSLGSRPSRLPTLSPGPRSSVNTVTYPAISHQPHSPYLDENVLHHTNLLNDLPSSSHFGSYFGLSPSPLGSLESFQLSNPSPWCDKPVAYMS